MRNFIRLFIVLFSVNFCEIALCEDGQSAFRCTELLGHNGTVTAVLFSPPFCPYGEVLVSASNDKTIYVWDLKTKSMGRVLQGHNDEVKSISLSSNGRILASVSWNGQLILWNMLTGEQIMSLEHKVVYKANEKFSLRNGVLWSVSVSPDGSKVATAGQYRKDSSLYRPVSKMWSGTVRVWDARMGKSIKSLDWHDEPVYCVVFSPNGRMLATASADKTIQLWDTDTYELVKTLTGHTGPVYSIAFSMNSKYLVSGGADKSVRIWDVHSGEAIKVLQGHDGPVLSVSFSPNGKIIASGSRDGTIRIWDAITGELIKLLVGHSNSVTTVSFSPGSELLATGSVDKTIRLWELK